MSSVRVLVGTKKGALILTKQEILDSKADPGLPYRLQIQHQPHRVFDALLHPDEEGDRFLNIAFGSSIAYFRG